MSTFVPKRYLIKTLGCQANEADSSTMAGILEALGFEKAESFDSTDVFIVNTCSIRQKSEDKAYGVGKLVKASLEKNDKKPFIIMAGCMVGSVTGERQRYKFDELRKKTPWVDAYINPSQVTEIPNILFEHKLLDEWALSKFDFASINPVHNSAKHAFVNISYGCDNFCTFCVVPYARGREISRTKTAILTEINHLIRRGFTEFTLCGQNVNSWGLNMSEKFEIRAGGDQKIPFAELLREIHDLPQVTKIDFLSSNPFDFTQDLIETLRLPKISNYLHIAVQSGNNEVLKRMNRRHTIEDFVALTRLIKQAKPSVEFGTDIIVGFPGETREQFMDTVELFKTVPFNVAFISIYSARKGTPAEKFFGDDVSLTEKRWRHSYLNSIWKETKPKETNNL